MTAFLILAVVLIGVVAAIVFAVSAIGRRSRPEARGDDVSAGADVITYLLLAAAVMVFVFYLASLGRVAFPSDGFVFAPERQVASALAAMAVSGPVTVVLWNRQRRKRLRGESMGGWALYLTLVEAVFVTAFVVALTQLLSRILTGSGQAFWTDVVVYGLTVVFHEYAIRDTRPAPGALELPRTVGAAIGMIPVAWGVGSVLYEGLVALYGSLVGSLPGIGPGVLESLAFILAGLPVWWHRWLYRWRDGHGPVRRAWAIVVSTISMLTLVGAATYAVGSTLAFLLGQVDERARTHFGFLPGTLAIAITAAGFWQHHRMVLGRERTDTVRFYELALAAFGVMGLITFLTLLVDTAATRGGWTVGASGETVVMYMAGSLAALGLWWRNWNRSRSAPRVEEAPTTPRRLYLLITGVITAVTAAVALIFLLVQLFQALLLDAELTGSTLTVLALVIFSAGAAFHLLRTYAGDRRLFADEDAGIAPFEVTVVASHPGMLAGRFPRQARMRVIYRDDDLGVVSDEMADEIVAAVGNRSAVVWVDESGFRVAHLRPR